MSHSGSTISVNSKYLNPIGCDFVLCLHVLNAFFALFSYYVIYVSQQLCVLCLKGNQYLVLFSPLTWDVECETDIITSVWVLMWTAALHRPL